MDGVLVIARLHPKYLFGTHLYTSVLRHKVVKRRFFLNTEIVQSNGKIPGLAAWPPHLDEFGIDNWEVLDPFYEKGGV